MSREKLKEDAKRYIQDLYTSHRGEDLDSWNNLISILFSYIDLSIGECREECKEIKNVRCKK